MKDIDTILAEIASPVSYGGGGGGGSSGSSSIGAYDAGFVGGGGQVWSTTYDSRPMNGVEMALAGAAVSVAGYAIGGYAGAAFAGAAATSLGNVHVGGGTYHSVPGFMAP